MASMENWKLPLYKIFTDDEDINLITKIVKRGTSWALGPEIEEFERSIAKYVGVDYCLSLNSGTSSLHALLLAYGILPNDEVIVPSFSFISTANSILFLNGTPKFADIEETTFGLEPNSIEQTISSKTKAVIPVDYGGQSCNIQKIKEITQEKKLFLIEDAAESIGSTINGKKVGTFSDSAMFSFCGNKVLTTGEGGAIVTNSKDIFEKIKLIRSHGRLNGEKYFTDPSSAMYQDLGYNWRMSTITASLGITQLQKLEKIISMRQKNAEYLSNNLSKISQIKTPKLIKNSRHTFQMYTIRLPNKKIRNDLQQFLSMKKIVSKIYFSPIHKSEYYSKKFSSDKISLPITEKISDQVLTLPMYPNMTKEEKEYLIDSIQEFFEIK